LLKPVYAALKVGLISFGVDLAGASHGRTVSHCQILEKAGEGGMG